MTEVYFSLMRLVNYLPHPKYFFIVAVISSCLMFSTVGIWFDKSDAPITNHIFVWSPDGSKLAMTVEADYGYFRILYLLDADGQNLQQLTTKTSHFIHVRWSEDSQIIYYGLGSVTGRNELMDWHQIDIASITANSPAIDAESFPSVTVEEMTANEWAGFYDRFNSVSRADIGYANLTGISDIYYAIDVCPFTNKNDYVPYKCSVHAEIRSIATDELIWSFDYYSLLPAKYGIIGSFYAPQYLIITLIFLSLGSVVAILRKFRRIDNRKQKVKAKAE